MECPTDKKAKNQKTNGLRHSGLALLPSSPLHEKNMSHLVAALDNIVMLTFQEFLTFGNSEAATKNYVAFDS